MGASHTTLSSGNGEDWTTPELMLSLEGGDNNSNNNNNSSSSSNTSSSSAVYEIDQHLFPGSGRMMRTYRLRHKVNSSTAIVKSMWVSQEHQSIVENQQNELQRIKDALQDQTHVAPFLYWSMGNYRQKNNNSNHNNNSGMVMMRPVSLVRPHLYTTLSDRLASRPFLTHVEKLWIVCQLLEALRAMHAAGVVHGFLTTENVGLSSWNWLVLVDIASYKARTALPDDDPSQYLYYFQEAVYNMDGTNTTPREKRCYLAPERFYTPNPHDAHDIMEKEEQQQPPLTTAMDVFSAGCIIMETFLNGERALDLGDLMEYRKTNSSQTLQQKLNKIEFSAVRAACRHMLSVDPNERLSASAYLERLKASELVPESFEDISSLVERVTDISPDARLAVAAASYSTILWKTLGVRDEESSNYLEKVLGPTMTRLEKQKQQQQQQQQQNEPDTVTNIDTTCTVDDMQETEAPEEKKEEFLSGTDLFAETEALLKRLESLHFDEEEILTIASKETSSLDPVTSANPALPPAEVKRSPMSQSSLIIYLQLVLSTVRHVLRPASKLVALQLMQRVGRYSTDEARLQRIIPVTVSLLQDQDPLVRASAIQVLTSMVSIINTFPPSDSKVFPQYIFKRVAHMITDPSLVVRLAFARSVSLLAETSHRFLDISHAVRLYEAVGGGGGGGGTGASSATNTTDSSSSKTNVFTDDVAKLLDDPSAGGGGNTKKLNAADSGMESTASSESAVVGNGRTLISSTYHAELSALHETVSRWVVHITTDQSEHSSPAKRALLGDLARLCNFFGLDGVMAFILPQILSFLNDRKDWQLRAALFENLPSVCHIIGRAATEHFVLPCLETALVDGEEAVVSSALKCLSELLRMGLLSRSLHLGMTSTASTNTNNSSESSSSSPG
jgi:phosphoinositide-3-kinase regulatory subunit 4